MTQKSRGVYRTYTDRQRATGVQLVKASVRPSMDAKLYEVSQQLGMPLNTLRSWVENEYRPVDEEIEQEVKESLKDRFGKEMDAIFIELERKRKDATYHSLMIGLGIAFDKTQLLNDEPTENVKNEITFNRTGLSSLPEHLAPKSIGDSGESQEI